MLYTSPGSRFELTTFEVIVTDYIILFLILILNPTTWLETPDSSPLLNAAPSHIRIAFFQLFWIYGTN
jgi:hypothetical protein